MKPVPKISPKKENGQIIVILALAIVAILGFAGLAIDGNRIYAAKRQNQSTADSAALAGAGAAAQYLRSREPYAIFKCEIPENTMSAIASDRAVTAAVASATQDNVTLARYDLSDHNGVTSVCNSDARGVYLDIIVDVTTQTPTTLMQVLNINAVNTSATATVRVYPVQSLGFGNALVSLNHECPGITFAGSSDTQIKAGGVFSNSCLVVDGGPIVKVYKDATTTEIADPGAIVFNEAFNNPVPSFPASVQPTPIAVSQRVEYGPITPPECNSNYTNSQIKNGTINPGSYSNFKVNGNLTFNPGLYCIKNGISFNGGDVITGNGVTLYFVTGGMTFNGNATVTLTASQSDSQNCLDNAVNGAVPGLLIYVDKNNSSTIQINGTSLNTYVGTIYAPSSLVDINGTTGANTLRTQVISKTIKVSGNATLEMDQLSCDQYKLPVSMDLLK